MTAPSLNPELVSVLKRLRLGGLLPTLAERLELANKHKTPYQDVLLMLLRDEISRRDSGAAQRRAQQAGLDPDMVLTRWDATAKVTYDRGLVAELCSLRFVADRRNLTIQPEQIPPGELTGVHARAGRAAIKWTPSNCSSPGCSGDAVGCYLGCCSAGGGIQGATDFSLRCQISTIHTAFRGSSTT